LTVYTRGEVTSLDWAKKTLCYVGSCTWCHHHHYFICSLIQN